MPSVLSQLFKLSWNLHPHFPLIAAREKIKLSTNMREISDLEASLQNFFYPTQKNNIIDQVHKAQQDFMSRALTSLFSQTSIVDDGEADKKFYGTKKTDSRHAIQLGTYINRMNQMNNMMELLKKGQLEGSTVYKAAEELLKIMTDELNKIVHETSSLSLNLSSVELTKAINEHNEKYLSHMITIQNFEVNNEAKKIFNALDNAYNMLMTMGNFNEIMGEAFERAMYVFNEISKQGITSITQTELDKIIEDFLGSINKSPNITKRGLQGSDLVGRKNSMPMQKYILSPKNNYQFSVSSILGGDTIDVSGAYHDKQGKVDVTLFRNPKPNNLLDLHASLKNWSAIDNLHDFGKTSLLNAMLRTGGIDRTFAFGLVIGYYGPKDRLGGEYTENTANLMRYAKACILVDTLIGFSQDQVADTLIINDRATNRIHVFSMNDIVNAVYSNVELLDRYIGIPEKDGINTDQNLIELLSLRTTETIKTNKKGKKKLVFDREEKESSLVLNQLRVRLRSIELAVSANILKQVRKI